jgi:cytochrome b involved in lipid metabolism
MQSFNISLKKTLQLMAVFAFLGSTSAVTMDEVRARGYTVISNNVYDLQTKWAAEHPGGASYITAVRGIDGTSQYMGQHRNDASLIPQYIQKYFIGPLTSTAAAAAPSPSSSSIPSSISSSSSARPVVYSSSTASATSQAPVATSSSQPGFVPPPNPVYIPNCGDFVPATSSPAAPVPTNNIIVNGSNKVVEMTFMNLVFASLGAALLML